MERKTYPRSVYLWSATLCNVNRMLKEVNAFEPGGNCSEGIGAYQYQGRAWPRDRLMMAYFMLEMTMRKVPLAMVFLLGEWHLPSTPILDQEKKLKNLLLANMILSRLNIEISDLTCRNTPYNLNFNLIA